MSAAAAASASRGGRPRGRSDQVRMTCEKARIHVRREKVRVSRDAAQKTQIGRDAKDLVVPECCRQTLRRGSTVSTPHDQLRDHGVVVNRDGVTLAHAGVDPDVRVFRGSAQLAQNAGAGAVLAHRVLGIDANLDRVAVDGKARSWRKGSASPLATRICHSTRSWPVIISVTGCST